MKARVPNLAIRLMLAIACIAFTGGAIAADADQPPAGWLGAALADAPPQTTEGRAPGGVVVTQIVDESPAQKAGLRGKDVILAVDGVRVASAAELIRRIKTLPPDAWVGLTIERGGAERQIDVRLGARPDDPGSMRFVRGWIGAGVMDLPPKLRAHFGAPEDAGVMVSDLEEGGAAEAAGIRLGDVIHAVDGTPVRAPGDLFRLIADSGVENIVEIEIGRDGAPLVIECRVDRAPSQTDRRR